MFVIVVVVVVFVSVIVVVIQTFYCCLWLNVLLPSFFLFFFVAACYSLLFAHIVSVVAWNIHIFSCRIFLFFFSNVVAVFYSILFAALLLVLLEWVTIYSFTHALNSTLEHTISPQYPHLTFGYFEIVNIGNKTTWVAMSTRTTM